MTDYLDLGYGKNLVYQGNQDEVTPLAALVSDTSETPGVVGAASSPGALNPITNPIDPSTIQAGPLMAQLEMAQFAYLKGGANGYYDGTGFFLGWDKTLGKYVFFFGNAAGDNIRFDGTDMFITGGLTVSSINIPDEDTTPDSFHVDTVGNTWIGTTTTSFTSNNKNAKAYILKNGDAFFQNAEINGVIKTVVFEKDVISAVGGQLLVANADILDTAMTALDASTLTIKGETTFAVNDILHMKDGTNDEYLRVTNIGSAPTYTVTRDLAGAYTADNNPAWPAGTAVVVEGKSDGASTYSGGFLKLLGAGTNSPKYSVVKRTGVAYNALTEYAVLGNLNGVLDYVAEEYGMVVGTEELGFMAFDPTNGLRVSAGKLSLNQRLTYGADVSQGDLVAIESDGKLYSTRITGVTSSATASMSTADVNAYTDGAAILVGHIAGFQNTTFTILSAYTTTGTVRYRRHNGTSSVSGVTLDSTSTDGGFLSSADQVSLAALTSNKAIGVFSSTVATTVKGHVLDNVNGVSPTLGTIQTLSSSAQNPFVERYSDTQALCAYYDTADSDLKVVELSISGSSLTVGSITTIKTGTYDKVFGLKRLGTSNYFIAIYGNTSSHDRYAICFEYNGSTFSVGAEVTIITSASEMLPELEWLTSTKAIVVWSNTDSTNDIKALALTRSGTTLTVGTAASLSSVDSSVPRWSINVTRQGKDSFTVFYPYTTSGSDTSMRLLHAKCVSTTPSLIAVDTTSYTNFLGNGSTRFRGLVKINPEFFAIAYQNSSDDYGVAARNHVNTVEQAIGICSATTSANNVGPAILQGYSDDNSGLTAGTIYYADMDGGLITKEQGGVKRVGVALASTELKLDI